MRARLFICFGEKLLVVYTRRSSSVSSKAAWDASDIDRPPRPAHSFVKIVLKIFLRPFFLFR